MNDTQLFRTERAIDLSGLTDAERRVLQLLAEGHTAKSIATALGTSAAAVNERLREARRKTGAGSSRELARLLKSQENRHEQIGVALRPPFTTELPQAEAEPWRPQTGVFAMIALLLITAVGAAAVVSQQPSSAAAPADSTVHDPQLGEIERTGPAWLYPMLREEPRDEQWAPRAERLLRDRYAGISLFGLKPTLVRVTCARTLCEVAASFGVARPGSSYTFDHRLVADMKKAGLLHSGEVITAARGRPPHGVYLAYYMREGR